MTTLGAAASLMPWATGGSAAVAVAAILLPRYASLGSLSIAALLPLLGAIGASLGAWAWPNVLFALACGLLSGWGLRTNIRRLRNGTERKVGQRVGRDSSR